MKPFKNPRFDLKRQHTKALELSLIAALLIIIVGLKLFPGELGRAPDVVITEFSVEVEEIPLTEQKVRPPRPMRPSIPIPTADEEVPEEETIESTDIDFDEIPPPPPPEEPEASGDDDVYRFIPFDKAPIMIGGMSALMKKIVYPEIARKAGVETRVIIGVYINKEGSPLKTQVLKHSGSNVGFEDAAISAIMKMKWEPALQRDRPVAVWMSIPVNFQLREIKEET